MKQAQAESVARELTAAGWIAHADDRAGGIYAVVVLVGGGAEPLVAVQYVADEDGTLYVTDVADEDEILYCETLSDILTAISNATGESEESYTLSPADSTATAILHDLSRLY